MSKLPGSLTSLRTVLFAALLCGLVPVTGHAEMRPTLSFSGAPGLLDMPSGEAMADADLSLRSAHFGPVSRNSLSFQITKRLSGSFRYAATRKWDDVVADPFDTYFDRSFDLRYQLAFEGKYRPGIAVGLVDIIGTGLWSGEYIAATKTFGDRIKLTAGLGWGRYGSYGGVGAPFGPRPDVDFGQGGKVRLGQWFKGDMAPFAGLEWKVNDKLGLKVEYSSDAYVDEAGTRRTFDRKSPFNLGLEYQVNKSLRMGAHYMYGSEFGVGLQFVLNPKNSPTGGLLGNAPPAVRERAPGAGGWSSEWVTDEARVTASREATARALADQGLTLERIALESGRVEVRIRLPRGDNAAQAVGRAARVLTATMPASVEQFDVVPVVNGLPLSRVVLMRRDMETLDNAAEQDALIRDRARIVGIAGNAGGTLRAAGVYPNFDWNLAPYIRASYFDPESPVRADLGLRFSARYELAPGWVLSGAVSKKLIGTLDRSTRVSDSVLPHVRSDSNRYDAEGDPAIDHLTLAWYGKPAPNLYSRVTVGYLERMYGGVSGELLWKPVDSRLAIGAEVNYVRQRDFDQMLGFQNYEVLTGHLSGYYSLGNGFHAQLDVGRYLAGDMGATLSIDREFANGWRVGAFATLTDVPFEDFGEGSFDKGIRVEIPIAWMLGGRSQQTFKTTLRPVVRDGGARLDVEGRLYDTVRSGDAIRLDNQWGRFWR